MSIPMPCQDSPLLHAIKRGTVSLEQEVEISEHLEVCTLCRAVVDLINHFDDPEQTAE